MQGIPSVKYRIWIKLSLLMFIPWIALVATAPIYNKYEPTVGGWPFLYFYLFMWIFIQPVLTFIVFKFVDKEAWR
ncbi:MAG: DUF3311 domain-containing protein [Candidatus Thermoplasmatota archaeon]|jgi:hypothetical protein|nr:DUF3311 domain-containing protein [Candidatus Thermoplasmatota archaeon]MCL5988769.1 DUF3311 domain-containing protein [Candidatus Thermoplasmatota archaeon]